MFCVWTKDIWMPSMFGRWKDTKVLTGFVEENKFISCTRPISLLLCTALNLVLEHLWYGCVVKCGPPASVAILLLCFLILVCNCTCPWMEVAMNLCHTCWFFAEIGSCTSVFFFFFSPHFTSPSFIIEKRPYVPPAGQGLPHHIFVHYHWSLRGNTSHTFRNIEGKRQKEKELQKTILK